MFYIVVSVINFIGWILYYNLSGGIFESTETSEVIISTIWWIVLGSVAALIVGATLCYFFKGLFVNVIHNVIGTMFIGIIFSFCFYPEVILSERIWGIVLTVLIMLFYVAFFVVGGDSTFVATLITFLIYFILMMVFTDVDVVEYGCGYSLMIGGAPSIINGIHNYFKTAETL